MAEHPTLNRMNVAGTGSQGVNVQKRQAESSAGAVVKGGDVVLAG